MRNKLALRTVFRQIVHLTTQPGFYGSLTIEFRDSAPLYSRVTEGRRLIDIPPYALASDADLREIITLLSAEGDV